MVIKTSDWARNWTYPRIRHGLDGRVAPGVRSPSDLPALVDETDRKVLYKDR
jgi:hypothetical protein